MKLEYDWQAGDDVGQWETISEKKKRGPPPWLKRVPRWAWIALAAVFVALGVGGYVGLRHRYEQAQQEIQFQIQGVIDLEARAYARGDADLFLAQQDETAPEWYTWQETRVGKSCAPSAAPAESAPECAPVLPAKVQEIDVQKDVAWVEVLEGDPAVRRARFYRQTGLGWKHTAPRVDFWGTAVHLRYGGMLFRYHRRDQEYVDPLVERIYQISRDLCPAVGCPTLRELEVEFAIEEPAGALPRIEKNTLVLASPWLSGLPAEGAWGQAYMDELTYWTAYELAAYSLRRPGRNLSPLQEVILSEYASWYSQGTAAELPILGRVIERRGVGMLPEVVRSLIYTRTLSEFMRNWMALWPTGHEIDYFETMLNIEREALRYGQRETFMLLQDEPAYWQNLQADFFDQVQASELYVSPAEVLVAEVDRYRARITVRGPALQAGDELDNLEERRPDESEIFFRRNGGEWQHTTPPYAPHVNVTYEPTWLPSDMTRSPPVEGQMVTIRFACYEWQRPVVERWVAAFNEYYGAPGTRVTPHFMSNPGFRRRTSYPGLQVQLVDVASVEEALAGAADTAFWYAFPDRGARAGLVDLSALLRDDPALDEGDFYPHTLTPFQWAGGTWGLPAHAHPIFILYDKRAFDEAGLPYPRPGWTLDEFLAAAQALTVRDGDEVTRYGFAGRHDMGTALSFVEAQTGPVVVDVDGRPHPALDAPQVVDAVRWYADLAKSGVMPSPDEPLYQEAEELIGQGRAAMWADSVLDWQARQEQADVGMVPFPSGAYEAHLWYELGYVMIAGAPHPEEAWVWLRYLTYQRYADPGGPLRELVPARRSVAEQSGYWEQWDAETSATIRYALEHPWASPLNEAVSALDQAVEEVLAGQEAEAALAKAQEAALAAYGAGE